MRVKPGVVGIGRVRGLGCLLVTMSVVAWAEPAALAAGRASVFIDQGEFEQAVLTIDAALAQPADLDTTQRAELYRLLALASLYLGRDTRAQLALEHLVALKPDSDLPQSSPPKLRALFLKAKAEAPVPGAKVVVTGPVEVPAGGPVVFEARTEGVSPGAKIRLFYRRDGNSAFSSVDFSAGTATVPTFEVRPGALAYYVEVEDPGKGVVARRGTSVDPLQLVVRAEAIPPSVPVVQRPWFWVVIGVGAAAIATGVVLGVTAKPPTATLPVQIQIEGQP